MTRLINIIGIIVLLGILVKLSYVFIYLFGYLDEGSVVSQITGVTFAFASVYFVIQVDVLQSYPEKINHFVALLYKTSNGEQCTDKKAEKLTTYTKTVILWYYIGSMNFIEGKFPRTFSGTGGTSGGTVIDNQMRVIDTLAGNDITKKEMVKKSLLYDALYTMEIAAENSEKERRKAKK